MARAVLLHGIFLSTLRELRFFCSDLAEYQWKTKFPVAFPPFLLTLQEVRKRYPASRLIKRSPADVEG